MSDLQGKMVALIEERKGWERLTSTPEWAKLVETIQEQVDDLQRNIIYKPLNSADDVFLQEFRKGQLEGRLSITVTAETIMSELDHEVQLIKEQINAGSDDESGNSGRNYAP